MDTHETYEILMVKALDGMLLSEEEAQWQAHLEGCPSCREEYAQFSNTRDQMNSYRERMLSDREQRLQSLPMRPAGRLSVVLIVGGILMMWAVSLWHLFTAPDVPLWLRVAHAMVVVGLSLGLALVGRDRWRSSKVDPYTEIDR